MPLIVQQGSEEWSRRTAGLRVSPFVALASYNHLLCEHRRRGRRFFDCIHEDSWKRNAIIRRERPRVKDIHACVAVLLGLWCCGMKCFADCLSLLCIHCTWLLSGKPYRIVFLRYLNRGFSVYFRSAVDQARLRANSMPSGEYDDCRRCFVCMRYTVRCSYAGVAKW